MPACSPLLPWGAAPRAQGRHRSHSRDLATRGSSPAHAGDDTSVRAQGWLMPGTAPRARGRLEGRRARDVPGGNSPLRGDETACTSAMGQAGEQPSVRGDDLAYKFENKRLWGTAPRARGQRSDVGTDHVRVRNSPACAGTTASTRLTSRTSSEQSRMRGDDAGPLGYTIEPLETALRARVMTRRRS